MSLYILPFDHRRSFVKELFGWEAALTDAQRAKVVEAKEIVYDGFRAAVASGVPAESAGVLVDEEFGAAILRDARERSFVTACPVEKSGQEEFEFEYGEEFARHIEAVDPDYAKALVRHNPEGNAEMNQRQRERLRQLSEYLRGSGRKLMLELIVPALPTQLGRAGGDRDRYDREIRPELMIDAMREFQEAGIEPDLWKLEGLDGVEACRRVAGTARRANRAGVGCIVLGRGASEEQVRRWLETAARAPGFVGFAVGRTTFWEPLVAWKEGRSSREQSAAGIARRYRQWAEIFEQAKER
jgi:5-dehydro-2-deoxygluconokinase